MKNFVQRRIAENELEAKANQLLAEVKATEAEADEDEYPAYTEAQLARHGENQRAFAMSGGNPIELAEAETPQDFEEELISLMGVTELKRVERCLLKAWLAGWTQTQMQRAFPQDAGRYSQQHLSRLLREALLKCYASGLSFEEFSKHTVYRKPAVRKGTRFKMVRCKGCEHEFVFGLGAGRFYCSKFCYEASSREG